MNDRELITGGAIVLVNVFTPLPGMTDAFIAAQTAEYRRLCGVRQPPAALAGRY